MKQYIVNIEKNDRDRTTRVVEAVGFNAQEAHKSVYMTLDSDEEIISMFRKPEGFRVFHIQKGFFE